MLSRIMGALQARRHELGKNREGGFTLVELLVVVIIIGILAAIAIPVYLGIQDNAKDSAAESDLANAKIAVVAYYTKNNALPTIAAGTKTLGDFTFSDNVSAPAITPVGTNGFCISVKSASSGTPVYSIKNDSGAKRASC